MPPVVQDILKSSLPLPVVAFLILQAAGFTFWGASVVNHITSEIAALKVQVANLEKIDTSRTNHEARILVPEADRQRTREDLAEIKALLRLQSRTELTPDQLKTDMPQRD